MPAQRATIVLLVDVSGSMRATDVKPSRLGAAQQAMTLFLDQVPKQVKIGLVSFSSEPDVLVDPDDRPRRPAAGHRPALTPRPARRSATGSALPSGGAASVGSARARARTASCRRRSSCSRTARRPAASCTPLQGAARARKAGIRVYTIALGTKHGTLAFRQFGGGFGFGGGGRFPVRPDPVTLGAIAQVTDGKTYRAKSASSINSIYRQLGSSIVHRHSTREVSSWFVGGPPCSCSARWARSGGRASGSLEPDFRAEHHRSFV